MKNALNGFIRSVGVPPTRSVMLLNGTSDEADGPEAHSTNGLTEPVQRMKSLLVIVILCVAGLGAAERGERERDFIRALELFDKAKTPEEYRLAGDAFDSLLQDGYRNGAVYYNLGNARMRAGEYGKAIAAYRKAKLYRPRDQYLEANLKQALSVAPGRLPDPPAPWWKLVLFWSEWLSYPEKFTALTVAFSIGALIAALALLLRRKKAYWLCVAAAAAGVLLSIDAALAYYNVNYIHRAVVVAETVSRKGIGESYDPAFTQPLKDGAEFTIIDRSGDWVFGHFEGVGDGWLRREAITE
jgi:tetratricopeptide (TPR) repeat protein